MVDTDEQFGGSRRTPFSPQIKPFFSARSGAVPVGRYNVRALLVRVEGTPGQHGASQIGRSGFPPQTGRSPRVGVGPHPLLRLGLRGEPSVSPLRPAAPPGARTHAFLQPPPLPSDWPEKLQSEWGRGSWSPSFLDPFGKVLETERIGRGLILSPALDPENQNNFSRKIKSEKKALESGGTPTLGIIGMSFVVLRLWIYFLFIFLKYVKKIFLY